MKLLAALFLAAPAFSEPASMRLADRIVAVAIAAKAPAVAFRPFGAFSAVDQSTGERTKLVSGKEYKVEAESVSRLIFGPHLFGGPARLLPGKSDEYVTIGDRKYDGNLVFRPNKDGTVTVVDELGLEEYLYGVLPHEMSPEWPVEALKAQAVVSRTFALTSLGRHEDEGFDVTDDNLSQVYTGLGDSQRIKDAVRSTAGQTLTYNGRPLTTYFHSTCGGHTSDPEDVWGKKAPKPLHGVKDKWCKDSPHYRWDAYFTTADILAALNKNGMTAARLDKIAEGERGTAGWLVDIKLKTEKGWKTVSANQFRLWLGTKDLKSVHLDKIKKRKKGFQFEGRGYGHGVGLCQWGARAQADDGRDYKKILDFYFPGAALTRLK